MDAQFKKDVKDMVDYMSEFEVEHFFESCECSQPGGEWEDITLCDCEANESHIMKKIKRVSDILDKEVHADSKILAQQLGISVSKAYGMLIKAKGD